MRRRRFLSQLMTACAVASVARVGSASAGQCIKVPASGSGPMKPLSQPLLENNLTRTQPDGPLAAGEPVTLTGRVLNEARGLVAFRTPHIHFTVTLHLPDILWPV